MNTNLGESVIVPVDGKSVWGDLILVPGATGLVLFAYGSGSSRFSERERFVSGKLNEAGISTFFIDLLTREEEETDILTREYRFNIPLLAERLASALEWAKKGHRTKELRMGMFGGSTGASACLVAAAKERLGVSAVVSRGGRTDLADEVLPQVTAATLLIVGGKDSGILDINQQSLGLLGCKKKKLEIVAGATHLFEEPGALERVAWLAERWFKVHL